MWAELGWDLLVLSRQSKPQIITGQVPKSICDLKRLRMYKHCLQGNSSLSSLLLVGRREGEKNRIKAMGNFGMTAPTKPVQYNFIMQRQQTPGLQLWLTSFSKSLDLVPATAKTDTSFCQKKFGKQVSISQNSQVDSWVRQCQNRNWNKLILVFDGFDPSVSDGYKTLSLLCSSQKSRQLRLSNGATCI